MKLKFIFIVCLSLALSACVPGACDKPDMSCCAPPPAPCPPPVCESTCGMTGASLAEASYAVSHSIVDLAETAQAAHPLPKLDPPPNPASYGMGQLVALDWSGPIEPLVRQLAKASGYRVNVLGTSPAIPVMVTVYDKNIMLADALRNVGYQAGRRATVIIYPEDRVIELRYAKN